MNPATQAAAHIPQIRLYQDWLAAERGLHFDSYEALWRWSTTELDAFWQSIWDYFDLRSPTPHTAVLEHNVMPGAHWFPGAQVNYAQQVFRHVLPAHGAGFPAVVGRNEKGRAVELTWPALRRQVASLALHLQAQGVQPGDRVAAYLPNIPETMVAFLATVSIGGVWSVCAPDMGTNAVLDRFRQIAPKVLIACDGVTHGGRDIDRLAVVTELRAALPSVQHLILHTNLAESGAQVAQALARAAPCESFAAATVRDDAATAPSSPCGCRLITRCGLSTAAAPPACPSPSCTVTVARSLWRWRSRSCTTTWAAATRPTAGASATTGTAPPAG